MASSPFMASWTLKFVPRDSKVFWARNRWSASSSTMSTVCFCSFIHESLRKACDFFETEAVKFL